MVRRAGTGPGSIARPRILLPRRPQHPGRSTRRTGSSRRSATPATRSNRARSSRAARCISPSTRRSPKTSGARACSSEYPPDFFDLDHRRRMPPRQRARRKHWREILEYFEPAYQLGMTATPLRDDNRDTYRYFGNPIYTYSLRQGIETASSRPIACTASSPSGTPPAGGRARRARPLRPRDPRRRIPDEGLRAGRRASGAHRGHRPAPHRVPEEDRPLRQDDRLLRRSGARERDARRALAT